MIKKQHFITGATALALLVTSTLSTVQAQNQKERKTTAERQAKVKILQSENGQFYMLDTTLTLTEGKSVEEAVKELRESNKDFKSLGAKPIKPTKVTGMNDIEFFSVRPSRVNDSARAVLFRSIHPDSIKAITVRRFGTDSARTAFFRYQVGDSLRAVKWKSTFPDSLLKGHRIIFKDGVVEVNGLPKANAITLQGNQLVFKRALQGDSLLKGHVFFKSDSALLLRADTFRIRERIKVERDAGSGEMKIFRLGEKDSTNIISTGEYEVIRLNPSNKERIIILRSAKSKKADKKESKKEKKKSADTRLDVQVYPNPTSGKIRLSFNVDKKANTKVRIVDSQGRAVFEDEREAFKGQYTRDIELNKYGKGMFVIQLLIGDHVQAEKVLVQ